MRIFKLLQSKYMLLVAVLNQEASDKIAKRDEKHNQVINFVLDDSKFNISI